MPNHFSDRLVAAVQRCGNPICLGLDPRFEQLPAAIRERAVKEHGPGARAAAAAILEFNRGLLDACAGLIPVCKPQIAFYEEHGPDGLRAYAETIRHARERGYLVIADAKRGDIGATAQAYARAFLAPGGPFESDALTVNPYLGADTLAPFLDAAGQERGIFVLVKTSNPGSGDLQDLEVYPRLAPGTTRPLYEQVAALVRELGRKSVGAVGFSNVGAVVGATHPEQLGRLRELMPETLFLIPGYGAQGGTAADAALGFRSDGLGAVVNNSRGLCFAFEKGPYAARFGQQGYAQAARAAAEQMAAELKAAL